MRIIEKDALVRVSISSIYPELMFSIPIETLKDKEALVFINGGLYSNDKRIADVKMSSTNNNGIRHYLFSHTPSSEDNKYETTIYTLISTLSKEAIDYIEGVRHRDNKKEVNFYLEMTFQKFDTNNDLIDKINLPKVSSHGHPTNND